MDKEIIYEKKQVMCLLYVEKQTNTLNLQYTYPTVLLIPSGINLVYQLFRLINDFKVKLHSSHS